MKLKTLTAMAVLAAFSINANAKTRLVTNCFFGPNHFACSDILPAWLDEVKKVTDGRVRGNIPPKSLAPPPEQLASVEKGIADVAIQFNGLIGNRIKGPLVAMNPFVGNNNAKGMSAALWETNRKYFPDEFETVHLLTQWVISPGQLFSLSDKPLNSVSELASRKMWALPGPLSAIAKKMGAGVVSSPAVKSNEIIARGIVDGHLGLDAQGVKSFQLMPYTKSMTRFTKSIYTSSFSLVINKDTWARISPEDQKAIESISGGKLAEAFGNGWDEANEEAFGLFEEAGISIVDADPAFEKDFTEAASFVSEKWMKDAAAAGIDAEAALDFYKTKIEENSK